MKRIKINSIATAGFLLAVSAESAMAMEGNTAIHEPGYVTNFNRSPQELSAAQITAYNESQPKSVARSRAVSPNTATFVYQDASNKVQAATRAQTEAQARQQAPRYIPSNIRKNWVNLSSEDTQTDQAPQQDESSLTTEGNINIQEPTTITLSIKTAEYHDAMIAQTQSAIDGIVNNQALDLQDKIDQLRTSQKKIIDKLKQDLQSKSIDEPLYNELTSEVQKSFKSLISPLNLKLNQNTAIMEQIQKSIDVIEKNTKYTVEQRIDILETQQKNVAQEFKYLYNDVLQSLKSQTKAQSTLQDYVATTFTALYQHGAVTANSIKAAVMSIFRTTKSNVPIGKEAEIAGDIAQDASAIKDNQTWTDWIAKSTQRISDAIFGKQKSTAELQTKIVDTIYNTTKNTASVLGMYKQGELGSQKHINDITKVILDTVTPNLEPV